jgi:hypothetical protein
MKKLLITQLAFFISVVSFASHKVYKTPKVPDLSIYLDHGKFTDKSFEKFFAIPPYTVKDNRFLPDACTAGYYDGLMYLEEVCSELHAQCNGYILCEVNVMSFYWTATNWLAERYINCYLI